MNETQIREAFHKKKLTSHHKNSSTLIVDELGLEHGNFRADISVMNSHFIGYEIKSDQDNLRRLSNQVEGYNSIFDMVYLITTDQHAYATENIISKWWGIILANQGPRGAIYFKTLRVPKINTQKNIVSIARLLWKSEAVNLLADLGVQGRLSTYNREQLYIEIVKRMSTKELQNAVRDSLISRRDWRDHTQHVQYDG